MYSIRYLGEPENYDWKKEINTRVSPITNLEQLKLILSGVMSKRSLNLRSSAAHAVNQNSRARCARALLQGLWESFLTDR